MKKALLILFLSLLIALSGFKSVIANPTNDEIETENAIQSKTEKYISFVYGKIKFNANNKINFKVFRNAFYGYLNLLESGKIESDKLLTVCDFTLSSNKKRLWVFDIENKKVLYHSFVAHGAGSGEEYAVSFSNIPESHQSSQGFYVTRDTYCGNNGYSLKLEGVDGSYNSNAYERAIVIHGADYVCEKFAIENQRLGRSHGCPALPRELAPAIIDKIKNGSCLFIYHSANNYLQNSRWLSTGIKKLPAEADLMDLNLSEKEIRNPRYVYVEDSKRKSDETASNTTNRKANDYPAQSEKKISSVVIIYEDSRKGISDTTVVK